MPDRTSTAPQDTPAASTGSGNSASLTSAAAVVRWALATALVVGGVLALALTLGGGAPQEVPAGLPDPGPVTGWALPGVRLLSDLAAIATVGLILTGVLLLPSPHGELAGLSLRSVRTAGLAAAAWAVLSLVFSVLTVSDVFAVPLSGAFDPALLGGFALDTSPGRALLAQSVLASIVAVWSRLTLSTREAAVLLGLALAALVPPVLTGHSAASGAHYLAVVSLLVHVVAASLWVGGLLGLAWVAWRGSKRLPAGLRRYSALAAWCLAVVAVSGVVNAAVRLGEPTALVTTAYGVLVLGKAAALLALGAFGWVHRRRTVADLGLLDADTIPDRRMRLDFVRLAGLELLVMAATVSLAVALSRTPTPVGDLAAFDPAVELLGRSLPPAPTPWRLVASFSPDGLGLLLVGLGAALYLQGLCVLRRRGDRWPIGRTAAWFTGLLILAWATVGGLGLYAHVLFSAHMVAHMVLSMVVPIFLVLGAPVTLALRTLPGARLPGEQGPRQLLLAVLHSRISQVFTFPLVALAVFVGSLYVLYFSSVFDVLMGSHLGHAAMELHFLAVGCLFFHVLVGVDPSPRRTVPLVSFVIVLVAFALHALFAVALMAETSVLGQGYFGQLDRPYATDLLADQYLGAQISWAMGELPLSIVMVAIFVQWFRGDAREAARQRRTEHRSTLRRRPEQDGEQDRGPLDEHEQYNAYLARLAEQDRTGPSVRRR